VAWFRLITVPWSDMTYAVRILFLNQIEPLPSKQLDGSFADL